MRKCVYLIGPDEMCLLHPSLHRSCVNATHTYHKILVSGKNMKKTTELNLNQNQGNKNLKNLFKHRLTGQGHKSRDFLAVLAPTGDWTLVCLHCE